MTFTFTKAEVANKSLIQLYELVANKMGYVDEQIEIYDCRYIDVGKGIQDAVFDYYANKFPGCDENGELGMLWVARGPKMDPNLGSHEVKVAKTFLRFSPQHK